MGDAYYKPLGLPEITTAVSAPEAGIARLFVKPGGLLYVKTSDATEHLLASDSDLSAQIASLQAQINDLQSQIDVWTELITTTTLTNNSAITFVNITELSIPVIAGKKYYLEYTLITETTNTTRGISLNLNVSSGATGALYCSVQVSSNADGTGALYQGTITSIGDTVTSPAYPTANEKYITMIRGVFSCTSTGFIFPSFAVEASGATITVLNNSIVLSREF